MAIQMAAVAVVAVALAGDALANPQTTTLAIQLLIAVVTAAGGVFVAKVTTRGKDRTEVLTELRDENSELRARLADVRQDRDALATKVEQLSDENENRSRRINKLLDEMDRVKRPYPGRRSGTDDDDRQRDGGQA
jgi:FtsZ-binding cell division protein ZapB